MTRRRLLAVGVLAFTGSIALCHCGSSQGDDAASDRDGGAQAGGDGGRDGGASGDGGADATLNGDDGGDAAGGAEAGTPVFPYGDRNLGLHEPYPDAFLVQNGGRFYNVQKPPGSQHVARGDGVSDDTDAIRDAFDYLRDAYVAAASASGTDPNGITNQTSSWIYLPAGTYRVTDTLSYRQPIVLDDGGSYPDLVRIRIAGESRETTTVKLDDAASGFGDVAHPKIVLEYQHDGTVFNNWPASNLLTNLTVDTGKGNPGAVAVWFQGANETVLYNVHLQAGDGAGFCGVLFQTGSTHGYYRDITVDGFDDGICQIPTPDSPSPYLATPNVDSDTALEHVTLRGQRKAGVLLAAGGTALRKLWIDESTTGAVGLEIDQVGSTVVLDDSLLAGNGKTAAAVQRDSAGVGQVLLARDLATNGYAAAISAGEEVVALGPNVAEYLSITPVVLFDGGTGKTLRLPVEDTPLAPWFDPTTEWASVDAYGADGGADDTAAVQAAMSSGKPVVVFPRALYNVKTVKVPATVQRIDFMYAAVNGLLDVDEASSTVLQLSHRAGGDLTRSAARPLALTGYDGDLANTSATPANLYLENVVNIGSSSTFVPAGQNTWIRFIDDEQEAFAGNPAPIDVWINGGTAWVLGFKVENKPVPAFAAMKGSRLEVLNGEVAQTEAQSNVFMVRNDDSSTFFMGFTELGYSPPFSSFTHIVEETRGRRPRAGDHQRNTPATGRRARLGRAGHEPYRHRPGLRRPRRRGGRRPMSITDVCLRRPVLAWMIMAGTILFGILSVLRIGVSQYPDRRQPDDHRVGLVAGRLAAGRGDRA